MLIPILVWIVVCDPLLLSESFYKQPACLAVARSSERAASRLGANCRRSRAADPANGDCANRFSGFHAAAGGTGLRVA